MADFDRNILNYKIVGYLTISSFSLFKSIFLSTESAIDDVQLDHGDLLVIVSYSKYPNLQEPRNTTDLGYKH